MATKKKKSDIDISSRIDLNKYPIDLKKVFEEIGYKTKNGAEDALKAYFKEPEDYMMYQEKKHATKYTFLTEECVIKLKNRKTTLSKEEGEAIKTLKQIENLSVLPQDPKQMPPQVGFIDILTPSEIIEVKAANEWKDAVGQVMVYSLFYENHVSRIHLFFRKRKENSRKTLSLEEQAKFKEMVEKNCKKLKIKVTWHCPDDKESDAVLRGG